MKDNIIEEMQWKIDKLEERIKAIEEENKRIKEKFLLPLATAMQEIVVQTGKNNS